MSKLALLALASVVAIVVVGCGGGGNSLSKVAFIEQGDAVCQKAEKEKQAGIEEFLQESETGPGKPLSDKKQEEMVATAIVPPIRKAVDELNGLGVPDEARASAIVEGVEEVVGEAEEDPAKLASTKNDPFAKVAKQARQYGFKTCFLYY